MPANRIIQINSRDSEFSMARKIRHEVFIQEQKVAEKEEFDEFEDESLHFILYRINDGNNEAPVEIPAVTARLRAYKEFVKFERIATLKSERKKGLARKLMEHMQEVAHKTWPDKTPLMHAQLSALGFYEKIGWKAFGPVFEEANIEHRKMSLKR